MLYTYPMMPLAGICPSVVVIYDMLCHAERSERSLLNKGMLGMLNFVAHRSKRIVTISNFSRRQIIQFLKVRPEKVIVAYPGCDEVFSTFQAEEPSFAKKFNDREGYILAVLGAFPPRKNAVALLRAYAMLPDPVRKAYRLVLVARKTGSKWIDAYHAIQDLKLSGDITIIEDLPRRELLLLYCNAKLFIVPSLYEGFSLPAVEAMANGLPIVASNRGAIPEIVGDSGLLVDPTDYMSMSRSIQVVLGDDYLARKLGSSGLQRSQSFTWSGMAKTVSNTLAEAVYD